ncbi:MULTISPECIES: oligosaccharyl transferase, archaeosortase A system-associated [unclassified Haloarcula]|uniref:oligosaccharyl transferase, archaeosortase A system-associated n=1 Tax=unclassified Haloarcula TaxID=2624677 RepID=UPI00059553F9|nr:MULTISPECIES: oligosaccharyl transferase, archaeosortase A system-associated [unclassified Haloarcula]AJF26731.1 oligosaccharyl transferase STT3 subunit [Haloarcula sp. CBA1115]MUV48464.1 oligosaccharyl transferase, archaeosortase A system-associated [Haloarcula sp. CBA1122]
MSQSRGYLDDNPELESALEWAERWYHVPVLLVLLGFMLWNRVRSWQNFIVDGEVLFSGNDAWYHYRSTQYVVQNWPSTMPFDPWTNFPYGTSNGQFGTLFDQIIATVALIIGLGSPSDQTVAMTVLFAPAVFGTLVAIPTYLIGRRLGGRLGGVTAVTVMAFSTGWLLQRSLVGFSDHHVAEALFQVLGVLGVMVAVSVAARDKPIYEQFLERDIDALRDTISWSMLAGVAIALYLWVWPPGVLLLGILGVFFLLRLCLEYVHDSSPEHTAIAGAITMITTAVVSASRITVLEITATSQSLLQPGLALAVGLGCVFMAWLARFMEQREYGRYVYPATVFGILAIGAVLMAVLTPTLWEFFTRNVMRVIGFSISETASTVGEAAPLRDAGVLFNAHGFAVIVAAIGGLFLLGKQLLSDDAPAEELLVVVWALFILLATFTQQRFAYYIAAPIAVLSGMVVGRFILWFDFSADDGIEYYQVITILAVLLVIVVPLFAFGTTSPVEAGETGPGPSIQGWDESLQWMEGNTPAEGAYGSGGDATLDYYGTYEQQEDFDYQEGQYGVLSWWDYGHWITTRAERVPNANPFQQGTDTAAPFLVAQNETRANDVLDSTDEDDAKTRYVAVDWRMVETNGNDPYRGKFFAPSAFVDGVQASDFYSRMYVQSRGGGVQQVTFQQQAYYETMVTRLYRFHGSAAEPQPIVIDWENKETRQGGQYRGAPTNEEEPEGQRQGQIVRQFQSMEEARQYVEQDTTSQLGGYGGAPPERVPAMEHYRLVGSSETEAFPDTSQYRHSAWTKIFERVPGATVEGTGPANTTVRTAVEMRNPATNKTFVYRQRTQTDQNGNFEMTVPYSTTGYDDWGTDEGYTNVSVRAETQYQFTAIGTNDGNRTGFTGTTEVTEGQVIGEDDSAATVELEPITIQQGDETSGESRTPMTEDAAEAGA